MLIRLLPIAIALLAALFILLARRASRGRDTALLAKAGLANAPPGGRMNLGGRLRETKIVQGVRVALGTVVTRRPAGFSAVGTHRPHQDRTTIHKHVTTRSVHLWIVYPQPYPTSFTFRAQAGEQPLFEGDYPDMAQLLASGDAAARAQALLAALAPLQGSFAMDQGGMDLSLPQGSDVAPELLKAAMDFWLAVREGSEYPYSA